MTNYQHRMKSAFESFCALVRQGVAPSEIVASASRTPVGTFAHGEVPPPPSLNEAIRRNAQFAEPTSYHTGEVPPPPSLNDAIRAALKGRAR